MAWNSGMLGQIADLGTKSGFVDAASDAGVVVSADDTGGGAPDDGGFDSTAGPTGGADGGGVVGPGGDAYADVVTKPNTIENVRDTLPDVDTSITPTNAADGAVQSDVALLEPPTDIDAATIGDYTAYEDVSGTVDDASTVEGRLEGLLSQDSDYMQRAESQALAMSNRRGMMNSSIAVGAAHGAAIDAALPIAQQDAAANLEQQFLNQGYSNEAAKMLAEQSVNREDLSAAFEQDTNQFNQTNTLEAEQLNQAATNLSNTAAAAEQNKLNYAAHTAELSAQLSKIDNALAMNLEQLASTFDIMENLDSINGAIYTQMVAEIGTILANEDKVEVATAKINKLLEAAGAELSFSNGETLDTSMLSTGSTDSGSTTTTSGGGSGGGRDDGNTDPTDTANNSTISSGGGDGGSGGGGGGYSSDDNKIICTALNNAYGLSPVHGYTWLKHDRSIGNGQLAELGYHKLFMPIAKALPKNELLARLMRHIVDVRTDRLLCEMAGEPTTMRQKMYKILLRPPCIAVGWLIKRGFIAQERA